MRAALLLALVTSAVAACATPGATFRSGVGDALLEHPPYYAGASVTADTVRIAHLPIAYQRGAMQAPIFDPAGGSATPIAELLAAMNAYLDSLGLTVRVNGTVRGTPPDVRFGCETDPGGPSDECKTRDAKQALGRGREYMVLAVGRPSREWVEATGALLDSARAARTLVITLEVANYLPRQRGWRGDKEVDLGTGYTVRLPWLTSLETPVSVLQLTGALVGRDGRAVRIGAEGMLARRTPLVVSALGAQALLSDEDVEQLRTARRDELPGRPLVWQVALRNLVAQLTGQSAVAQR
jgi:hypothetical protein